MGPVQGVGGGSSNLNWHQSKAIKKAESGGNADTPQTVAAASPANPVYYVPVVTADVETTKKPDSILEAIGMFIV